MKITRREFLQIIGSCFLSSIISKPLKVIETLLAATEYPDIAVVNGKEHFYITQKAIENIGGIKRFVKPGDIVVVKPNIAWSRTPEQAANTNPEVVKAIVDLCYKAGASEVKVFDRTCDDPKITYELSGIKKTASEAGAIVKYVNAKDSISLKIPQGIFLKRSKVLKDVIEADRFINVPIAKHHASALLTLGMKNLMGITGDYRRYWHINLHQSIADFSTLIKPDLIVIDATRILVRNGPRGGNLADVRTLNTVIVSTDPVAADGYASRLFNYVPENIRHIKLAYEHKIGEIDLNKLKIAVFHY